ncbi:unnamed protein product [Ophioblennius macclurei]
MTFPGHNPQLLHWSKQRTPEQAHLKNMAINNWRKRVQMASDVAVSEVFPQKKHQPGIRTQAMSLQNSDQLRDHDNAYSEAHALLVGWMGNKLQLNVESDDDDVVESSAEKTSGAAPASAQPSDFNCNNFRGLYNHLAEEEEQSAISNVLQGLMKQEVLNPQLMMDLTLDAGQKRLRDPILTMELRHQQVREKRARREAEKQRQQIEKEARQGTMEEAKRKEREAQMKRMQEAHRQEEMVQQEIVKLRRQMVQRRDLARQRERERAEEQRVTRNLQSAPVLAEHRHIEQLRREQKIQSLIQTSNLKCLQRHFFGWYSVVLKQRLLMGKAKALCEWKMRLRAWRGWRAVVWTERNQREVARTEEELRTENRQGQLAAESDRRRLLRRCLNEWRLWSRMEKEQRELLAQQEETRRKMAELISNATTGNFRVPQPQPTTSPPETRGQFEASTNEAHQRSRALTPKTSTAHPPRTTTPAAVWPSEPWQVSRRHASPNAAELCEASRRGQGDGAVCAKNAASTGAGFESTHATHRHIITQQRKLLKEQQEQIARLKGEQNIMGLQLEMERSAQLACQSAPGGSRPRSCSTDPRVQQSAPGLTGEADGQRARARRKAAAQRPGPHPIIQAMEARAHQRAERRKEIEELKRKKEEQKLAEMKAAEERRQREEEEEKLRAAEKRKEEKRLEREREEEKHRQRKRQQELLKVARRHYDTASLLRRGLAPWKRLIQLRRDNMKLAESHHNLVLLRRCIRYWQQSARESLSEKEACADQLYQYFLLRRSLSCWKRLRDERLIQEERAERFYRKRTLRKFLLALHSHVTQEMLLERDRRALAREHNNRRLLQRCFLAWREFPDLMREERKRDVRRQRLIRKVAEVLPNFCSNPL